MATYDRISNGDKTNIVDEDGCATDEWGVRYQGHSRPDGGGLFAKDFGLKSKCQKLRQRRCLVATLFIVGICVLTIILIVVTHSRNSNSNPQKPHFRKWSNATDGLYYMPRGRDGSVLIDVDVNKYDGDGYGSYIEFLDYHLHDYQPINQQDKKFYVCKKGDAPADKVCIFNISLIGDCDHFHQYGYTSGTPCVVFFLNPPRNHVPVPYPKDSKVGKMLGKRWSPDHIGLTCGPATKEDEKYIGNQTIDGPPIEYLPPEGFATYYFRNRTISDFLVPIAMVKFNTIANFAYVNIRCKAWAQNFHNSEFYTQSFAFYIK